MAKRKTFENQLNDFIDGLYSDGTIARWEAEKRLKEQERSLKRLDRKAAAINKLRKKSA
jgi:hypothetical protein